jgi:hypothetical protein
MEAMTVYVRYEVPVLVEVDLRHRKVVAVHVEDEAVSGPLEAVDGIGRKPRRAAQAIDIAEASDWPTWQFG